MLLDDLQGQVTHQVHDSKQSSNALYHVEYDDGEAHDEDLKTDRFRWHGPRATSAITPYHKDMRLAMLELEAENVHGDKENDPVCTLMTPWRHCTSDWLNPTSEQLTSTMQGTVSLPKGGVPVLSEAVGWRIGFWWEGTREWVDGEVLSYRASDARHLVVFADGEFEWMSLSVETIRWVGNTRERGNRLSPISFGLDQGTSPPKGREAVDWVVDVYDKNTNQMQRVEISGFDSVTGKHKVVSSDSRKVSLISLTASKIVWRFPPGLPTPATDAGNPSGKVIEGSKVDMARQGCAPRATSAIPGICHTKMKVARQKRKGVPAVTASDATAPEGTTAVSPSAAKGSKKGFRSSVGKAAGTPKGSTVKSKITPAAALPVPNAVSNPLSVSLAAQATAVPSKRSADTAAASGLPAKRVCMSEDAQPAAASILSAADVRPQPAESLPEDMIPHRRRRSVCIASAAQTQQHDRSTQADVPVSVALTPHETKVVHFSAPREVPGPVSISNVRPASIWPALALQPGMREAAFVRCSLAPAQSMVKNPGTFQSSVQCLLAATERRQQFVRALMQHLGDTVPAPAASAPLATPPLRTSTSVPSGQNAGLMTIPTDPRRASKPQVIDDRTKVIPTPQAGMCVSSHQQPPKHPPRSMAVPPADAAQPCSAAPNASSAALLQAGASATPPTACTPAQPRTVLSVGAAKTPVACKPASVSQFTPKFAPLSSFQCGNAVLGSAPVALPAVAPDSKAVQAMLKQRAPTDAAQQTVTLSMSMVAKAVSAAVPSSLPQVVRSPPSDQTSSSCKIDDVRCASLAKLGGTRQQQTPRVSAATWQVSQMQNAGTQKQGVCVNSRSDVRTEPGHGVARVQDGSCTATLNRTVSSNVRTANLRWGGPPLVAARASIGLKGGSSGAGSAGGRACG